MHGHDGHEHRQDHDHDHDHEHGHSHEVEDNSHAGQGSVLLDIGGDVGALVVNTPADMIGVEIEICPEGEDHAAAPREHVAVVARPTPVGDLPSLVFGALVEGRYELYRKSDGPTQLVVSVTGGTVTQADWPTG